VKLPFGSPRLAFWIAYAALWLVVLAAFPRLFAGHGLRATYVAGDKVLVERVEKSVDGDRGRWPAEVEGQKFSATWSGTIVFPRARYQLGLESEPAAKIYIDDRLIKPALFPYDHNRSGWPPPENLEPGKHAIRIHFDAASAERPGRIRLLSLSPGRRGLPEYVPPSMLFPAPPAEVDATRARAHFSQAGWLALLLVLGGAAAFLGPRAAAIAARARALRADPEAYRAFLVGAGVCGFALAIRCWQLSGAGNTWDEDVHRSAGLDYVVNLLAFDFRESSWRWIPEHPTITMLYYGVPALFEDGFVIERVAGVLAGLGGIVLTMLIARRLFDRPTALLAGAVYACFPLVIALHKNVSHEAVVGLTWNAALYAFLLALDRRTTRSFVFAGILCGLAVASRATSGVLTVVTFGLYVIHVAHTPRGQRLAPWRPLVLLWIVAFCAFLAVWPYLWTNIVPKIAHMFGLHGEVKTNEMYLGRFIAKAPWHYLFVYFGITMPALTLGLTLVGLGRSIVRRTREDGMVVVWLFGSFLVAFGPAIKDGARYAFPAFGAAAILAARACLLAPRRAWPIVGALVVAYTLGSAARVHPYYLDYYNELVGGPGKVQEKRWFELTWWGEGLAASTGYVDRVAPPGASVWLDAEPKHVMVWRDDLVRKDAPGADFVIHNDNVFTQPFRQPGYTKVFEAKAGGAVMSAVYKRNP
jgi:hypothetical protein